MRDETRYQWDDVNVMLDDIMDLIYEAQGIADSVLKAMKEEHKNGEDDGDHIGEAEATAKLLDQAEKAMNGRYLSKDI